MENSDIIPESPYFSTSAFATSSGVIVVGDGVVELISRTGPEPKEVWSSILSHEWAHQIQFSNIEDN